MEMDLTKMLQHLDVGRQVAATQKAESQPASQPASQPERQTDSQTETDRETDRQTYIVYILCMFIEACIEMDFH